MVSASCVTPGTAAVQAPQLCTVQRKIPNIQQQKTPFVQPVQELASVGQDQLLNFERKGHCTVRRLLPAEDSQRLKQAIQKEIDVKQLQALKHRVRGLCAERIARTCTTVGQAKAALRRGHAEVGFLQFFNLWR